MITKLLYILGIEHADDKETNSKTMLYTNRFFTIPILTMTLVEHKSLLPKRGQKEQKKAQDKTVTVRKRQYCIII
jgi:hypothetical protein